MTSKGQNLTQCCIFFHISVEIIGQFFLVPSGEKSDVCIKPVDAQNFHSASYYGKTENFREIFEGRKAITIRTEPTLVKYCYPMLQGQNETYKYP